MRSHKWLAIGICAILLLSLVGSVGAGPADNPGQGPPQLEKKVFIHYKKDFAKPPEAGRGAREVACYGFLAKGLKWKDTTVSYVIDPTKSGLQERFVESAISAAAEVWDSATTFELFGNTVSVVYDGSWDIDAPDGRNELVFDNYPEADVIAITVVWGYFSVPPPLRQIVEFDVLFDTDFAWGNALSDSTKMDLQNIATHELGHGVGLGDVYQSSCSAVTMYGYSDYGEIQKRTLEQPDITGLQTLYGN